MKNIIIILYILLPVWVMGQENVAPLHYNPQLFHSYKKYTGTASRKTATTLTLPFFEDFTQYDVYPDSSKWTDYKVFINNTMGASPVAWGVATFDDLDPYGIPYDSFNNSNFRYADSLTSQPIDLSLDSAADSVYLSFMYQPQGNGFYPLPQDSLMLFMKTRYGGFVKVWSVPGSSLQPFKQVMIPITDSLYFHDNFQFRFVNIAALFWADAVWNVDYIRLDRNRNMVDTLINDIAFTASPTFLLNDYTSMPYYQYKASPLSETVTLINDSLKNNYSVPQNATYHFGIQNVTTIPINIFAAGAIPALLNGYQTIQTPESISIPALPSYPKYQKVTFENKYYIENTTTTGPPGNDTIVRDEVFDNYLAYDDGTAEKSYYLNLFPTLPGKVAIEFHLNQPDTLRGLAIYFGRQIPFSSNKTFSINVYTALAGINGAGADALMYASDELTPEYADSLDHFWYYTFQTPISMPPGTFYAGTMQCADCGADSLYLGLDVNRIGSNHAYYNVVGTWNPSLISGAIMIRPLLGKYIHGTSVTDLSLKKDDWQVLPNPATNNLTFKFAGREPGTYHIMDLMGHTLLSGTVSSGDNVDISAFAAGMYIVDLVYGNATGDRKKIIKL